MRLEEAISKARAESNHADGKCSMCAAGDEPENGLHRGQHRCGNAVTCMLCHCAGMGYGDQCAACGRIEKRKTAVSAAGELLSSESASAVRSLKTWSKDMAIVAAKLSVAAQDSKGLSAALDKEFWTLIRVSVRDTSGKPSQTRRFGTGDANFDYHAALLWLELKRCESIISSSSCNHFVMDGGVIDIEAEGLKPRLKEFVETCVQEWSQDDVEEETA